MTEGGKENSCSTLIAVPLFDSLCCFVHKVADLRQPAFLALQSIFGNSVAA